MNYRSVLDGFARMWVAACWRRSIEREAIPAADVIIEVAYSTLARWYARHAEELVIVRDAEERVRTIGKRHAFRRLSSASAVIIVVSFDVLHQCGQFLYFHRLLVNSHVHDSQYVALPVTNEFFER
jgi:hypothetical protein